MVKKIIFGRFPRQISPDGIQRPAGADLRVCLGRTNTQVNPLHISPIILTFQIAWAAGFVVG